MSRHLFALLLLAATLPAFAVTPARESANGTGGHCPEAEASLADESGAAPRDEAAQEAAKPTAGTPSPGKGASLPRPNKTGLRWHTFLPGMFK